MRFSLFPILLVSAFALAITCTDAAGVGSLSDSKKMEVKKALTRLRKMHRADTENRMIIPPVAAYYYMMQSTPSTSAQSAQILHAVEDDTPLPKAAKAVVAVVGVGLITGVIISIVQLTKLLGQAVFPTGSDAA